MLPPNARLDRLVDAATEPLTLDQAKRYCRVDDSFTDDDEDILDFITAARYEAESIIDQAFIATTFRLTLDYLPFGSLPFIGLPWMAGQWGGGGGAYGRVNANDGGIILPMSPLISVASVSYIDQGGIDRTLDPSSLIVLAGSPGKVYPSYGTFFPLAQPRPGGASIIFTAGYGPDASTVPRPVAMAIRMLVACYYQNRSTNVEAPDAIVNLLRSVPYSG